MKKILLSLLALPAVSHALSFAPDTIFLDAGTKTKCESMGGSWTEWYSEKYCTKSPDPFTDVSTTHPQAQAISYVKSSGIVKGYDDGTFRPDATINRVELVKIIQEAELAGELSAQCFINIENELSDVSKDAWYAGYLAGAMCDGSVSGYPDGTFRPANPVLVVEAAKIISVSARHSITNTSGAWYEGYINNLANRGALPLSLTAADAELTRGQMAEMIYRLKTNNTSMSSHTLATLTGQASVQTNTVNTSTEVDASAEVDADVDAEIDAIFEDLFEEDGLDLDSLLDF